MLLQRAEALRSPADFERIEASERWVGEATEALETHRDSARKLQRILFGSKTEKTPIICGPAGLPDPPPSLKPAPKRTDNLKNIRPDNEQNKPPSSAKYFDLILNIHNRSIYQPQFLKKTN